MQKAEFFHDAAQLRPLLNHTFIWYKKNISVFFSYVCIKIKMLWILAKTAQSNICYEQNKNTITFSFEKTS